MQEHNETKSNISLSGGLRTLGCSKKSLDEKPLITIVTVVFNSYTYLEETIISVISQTYDNFEYIIIDGGSTDGTLDIIRKYEHTIDYWISEKDQGIYDAMNKSMSLITGEWVNFMNSGDMFFDKNVLQKIYLNLSGDIVYGNHAIYINDKYKYVEINVKKYSSIRNIPCCHQSLFMKKSLLLKFPFDLNYHIAGDYDQFLKCQYNGANVKHIPMTVSLFLDGGLSSVSRKKIIYEYYNIMKKYHKLYAFFVYYIRIFKYYILGR